MNEKKENVFNFEKLLVYQKSLDFIDKVYDITDKFPISEKFNITDQFRRAATSIALNIGEGSGGTDKEFNSFLRISKRSVKECVVCTTVSFRRKYINAEEESQLRSRLVEIAKMNSGLSKAVRMKIKANTSGSPVSSLQTPD
jgi:four helix bundle protein